MIFMMQFFSRGHAAAALALALLASGDALAQGDMSGVPNAMQGFAQNRDQAIHIEAAALEMRGKEKEATFDTRAKLITMVGGVVLTQCKNVLRGDRLKVDMTTGVSRVESDSGKVQGMFIQGQDCGSGSGGSKPAPAPVQIPSLIPGKK